MCYRFLVGNGVNHDAEDFNFQRVKSLDLELLLSLTCVFPLAGLKIHPQQKEETLALSSLL